ncbi:hypothetical protein TNCV_2687561 [Trichonephila clavipes]|nr:hypothetical protein TNCV_2687561 [Trichonephila clavipes]
MASVFSRHESKRLRLGRSMKTSFGPPTTPTNSPRSGKSSSGRIRMETWLENQTPDQRAWDHTEVDISPHPRMKTPLQHRTSTCSLQ